MYLRNIEARQLLSPTRRDNTDTSTTSTNVDVFIAIGVILGFLVIAYMTFLYLRRVRRDHKEPRYLPTKYLKSRWRAWNPSNYGNLPKPAPSHSRDASLNDTSIGGDPFVSTGTRNPRSTANIDHRQSVRSIVSLPPYRQDPRDEEQVIAREGERAGIDTVVEFPESEAEIEAQREEEMQTLFAIRQARRLQAADREARREARDVARRNGDWNRLAEIEQEARIRNREDRELNQNAPQDVGLLIAELNSQREARRDRRVPSVSYNQLGTARHDGSRIRAGSMESDHRPLLNDAASIASSRGNSRASSPFQDVSHAPNGARARSRLGAADAGEQGLGHHRGRSTTSVQHATNAEGSDTLTPQISPESTSNSHNGTGNDIPGYEPPSYDTHCAEHGGCPDAPHSHMPDGSVVIHERPNEEEAAEAEDRRQEQHQYPQQQNLPTEDAPPYSSPISSPIRGRGEGPRLPLPSIVIGGATPGNSVPATPVVGGAGGGVTSPRDPIRDAIPRPSMGRKESATPAGAGSGVRRGDMDGEDMRV